ncbi:MAG: TonB C-terminal domain-containing protein [candidate division Zixibacteria bacterium]|nr:TonB C-terminal domain-containing protein [candidate division Zixibacteria bacterium]
MRNELYLSLSLHLILIFFLAFFVPVKAYYQMKGYPQIYKVGLVNLPAGGPGGGGGESVKATSGKSAPAQGIGLKEMKTEKKTKTQVSQKKTGPAKKPVTSSKKQEIGKIVSAKEGAGSGKEGTGEGFDISLGGGLGSAHVEGGDFGSPYYLNIAFGRIREAFTNPLRQTNLPVRAAIYFKIIKSGKVVDPIIESSSGISIFDQAALRAVLSADPLPPLPQEYKGEWLGIHLEFEFLP